MHTLKPLATVVLLTSLIFPPSVLGASKIAAGWMHTAVVSGETISIWGYNHYGQLGIGSNSDMAFPVSVPGISGVVAISAGYGHTIAVKSDGSAWTWGNNYNGQLGNGTNTSSNIVASSPVISGIKDVAAGGSHTVALRHDGTVWGWGRNTEGQLGDDTQTQRYHPVQAVGLNNVVAVAAGESHTLAIKIDGSLWAWGNNSAGQLGDGTRNIHALTFQVPGIAAVSAVSCGLSHTLALKNDGTVWSWGSNASGQLGDGTSTPHLSPSQVPGLSGVKAIAAGEKHSVALMSDGTVWTWGRNYDGQLGRITSGNDFSAPAPVPGIGDVVAVAAGQNKTVALKSDGTIWAWGRDWLGNGSLAASLAPVKVEATVLASDLALKYLLETSAYAYANINSLDNNWVNEAESTSSSELVTHVLYHYPKYSLEFDTTDIGKPALNIISYPDGPIPIILIHGWQGDGSLTDPKELAKYDNSAEKYFNELLKYFSTNPYLTRSYKIYLYKYPSYKHITYNARILKELIESIKELQGKEVVILAHSMGGLVARSLIEEHGFNLVRTLITLATPHHGSPAAIKNWIDSSNTPWLPGKDMNTPGANDLYWDNYDGVFEWAQNDFNILGMRRIVNPGFDEEYRTRIENDQIISISLNNILRQTYPSQSDVINRIPNPWLTYLNERLKIYGPRIPYIFYGGYATSYETNLGMDQFLTSTRSFPDEAYLPVYWAGYINDVVVPTTSSFFDCTKHDLYRPKGDRNPNLFAPVYPDSHWKSAIFTQELILLDGKYIYHNQSPFNASCASIPVRFFKDYNHDRMKSDAEASDFLLPSVYQNYVDAITVSPDGSQNSRPLFDTLKADLLKAVPVKITYQPNNITVLDSVQFDGSEAAAITTGSNVTITWDFGDGTTGSGATSSHVYKQAGTKTVKFIITDEAGSINMLKTLDITIKPYQVKVSYPDGNYESLTVKYSTDHSPDVSEYSWNFGDGTPVVLGEAPPAHTYTASGSYSVTLTLTLSDNSTIESQEYIAVGPGTKTIAGHTIQNSEVWRSGGTYIVTGQVIVAQGATLTIEPGAVVKFNNAANPPHSPGISVQGTLKADGTATSPIIFTSVNDNSIGGTTGSGSPAAGSWDKIYFAPACTNSVMRHAVVKYGGYRYAREYCQECDNDEGAVLVTGSSVVIANSEINGNRFGIVVSNGAKPVISACNILNNSADGIYLDGANPTIQQTIFKQNGNGIEAVNRSAPLIVDNTFDSNGGWAVVNTDKSNMTIASNNNWGDPTGPLDDSDDRANGGFYNPIGKGNRVSDNVLYYPWTGGAATLTATPTGLTGVPRYAAASLRWDSTTDSTLGGYKLYYGTTPGAYTTPTILNKTNTHKLTGLIIGQPYYLAVSAMNKVGVEGEKSAEITVTPINQYAIELTVSGSGTVLSKPAGIAANVSTSALFDPGTVVTLGSDPAEYSLFTGWSGSCSGSGDCNLTMSADLPVTAAFDRDAEHQTRIEAAEPRYFPTILGAFTVAAPGDTVKAWGTDFTETVTLTGGKSVTFKGGFNEGYTAATGQTRLKGSLTIGKGALTVENLIIW